jgi:hypothetical protein
MYLIRYKCQALVRHDRQMLGGAPRLRRAQEGAGHPDAVGSEIVHQPQFGLMALEISQVERAGSIGGAAGDLKAPGGRNSEFLGEAGIHRRADEQRFAGKGIEADPVIVVHVSRFGANEDALTHLRRDGGREPERRLPLRHAGDPIIENIAGAKKTIFDEFLVGRDREFAAVIRDRLPARIVNAGPVRFGADGEAERGVVAVEQAISGFEGHPVERQLLAVVERRDTGDGRLEPSSRRSAVYDPSRLPKPPTVSDSISFSPRSPTSAPIVNPNMNWVSTSSCSA